MLTRRRLLASLAGCSLAAAGFVPARAGVVADPLGTLRRSSNEPLLRPQGTGFESAGVFNPAAVKTGDGTVLLYRAQDAAGTSRIGYAKNTDGIHFERRPQPVLSPVAPYEAEGGVEDPRLVLIDGTYYMTYTAYNSIAKTAQLCLATSKDLIDWTRQGVTLPANQGTWNVHWTKSGAIIPQQIGGRWFMYYLGEANENPPAQMGLAVSDDLIHWKDATPEPVLHTRVHWFDSRVVEPGPAPLVLDEGILLIYNGADDDLVYSIGWALFDRNDPAKLLARSPEPAFRAEQPWERVGQVPSVVFVEGLIRDEERLMLYYGAADKYIGLATTFLRAT